MRKNIIKKYYYKNKLNFFILTCTAILKVAIMQGISISLQQVIDISMGSDLPKLYMASLYLCLILLGMVLLMIINMYVCPKFRKKGISQLKKYIFGEIISKSVSAFNENETSIYSSSLINDLNYVNDNYFYNIFDLIVDILLLVSTITIMFIYNYLLTFVSIGFALLPFLIAFLFGSRLAKYEKAISNENSSFMHFIKDTFNGFTTIYTFKAHHQIKKLFEKKNEDLESAKEKSKRIQILLSSCNMLTSVLAQFGVFVFGGYLAITKGTITPGVLIIFVQLMNYIVGPLSAIPDIISKRFSSLPLLDKMISLMAKKQEENKETLLFNDSIKFVDVSFSYEEKEVLKNINLTFEKNKTYAIVGASGSGKSTMLNLLMGRKLNYQGDIYYDDCELRDISLNSLTDAVSLVEQNVFVFDDTIKNNITMFNEVDDCTYQIIIEKSGLTKLIEEKQDSYKCGEGGINLSGGERQRISIARALLKNSKILFLDEATSALDNETSKQILDEILRLDDITKVIITHRLEEESLKKFDQIITLKEGRVVEVGSFDELINNNKTFSFMYNLGK